MLQSADGARFVHDPAARGYVAIYRQGETNYCPACGRSSWYVGRLSAECCFCATAVPLRDVFQGGASAAHTHKNRPVFLRHLDREGRRELEARGRWLPSGSGGTMPIYRVYLLQNNRLGRWEDLEAPDDLAAVEAARSFIGDHHVELWFEHRKITTFVTEEVERDDLSRA